MWSVEERRVRTECYSIEKLQQLNQTVPNYGNVAQKLVHSSSGNPSLWCGWASRCTDSQGASVGYTTDKV